MARNKSYILNRAAIEVFNAMWLRTRFLQDVTHHYWIMGPQCFEGTQCLHFQGSRGPKRDEVTGEWRKPHNEELNDLYSLPNMVRVVKSRRMRWAGHVARMGEDRVVHRVLVGEA